MPLILGTNSIKDTGYDVANSCRINKGDSPSLVKDQSASPTHDDKGTLSFWFKIGKLSSGDGHYFFSVFTDSNNRMQMLLQSDNTLKLIQKVSGSTVINLVTSRVFRDPSAWYHLVIACDSSQGTAANRIKIYINGVQETSFSTETYCNQDVDIQLVKGTEVCLGAYNKASPSDFFDGYLAEMVLIDGTQNAVTDFGEFDEDSPTIWKPKDVSGLTFGTNGFYLDFEDSSNLGNDANGGTDFTENNLAATDQTTDTPTNNFATLNPLHYAHTTDADDMPLSEGNTKANSSQAGSPYPYVHSTIAVASGKWYAEFKVVSANGSMIGISDGVSASYFGDDPNDEAYFSDGNLYTGNTSFGDALSNNDILMVAVDLDNSKIYFGINGTWQNSGDPTSGATGTGAASITTSKTGWWHFAVGDSDGANTPTIECNFGNPPYANSSDAADADGYGAFEYAPPSGFFALCTKNLAEYGG